nr:MAG TPA: hypothetical protein [Caudoviricetes sp.]
MASLTLQTSQAAPPRPCRVSGCLRRRHPSTNAQA